MIFYVEIPEVHKIYLGIFVKFFCCVNRILFLMGDGLEVYVDGRDDDHRIVLCVGDHMHQRSSWEGKCTNLRIVLKTRYNLHLTF